MHLPRLFQSDLRSIPGVSGVHELRLFAVSTNIKVASVHLTLPAKHGARASCSPTCSRQLHPAPPSPCPSSRAVRRLATQILRDRRKYDMVTVQVERMQCKEAVAVAGCEQCRPIGQHVVSS